MTIQTKNLASNLIQLTVENISFYAFQFIVGNCLTSKYKFTNEYIQLKSSSEENKALINDFQNLAFDGHFPAFASLVNAEFILNQYQLQTVLHKLLNQNKPELTQLAEQLETDSNTKSIPENFEPLEYSSQEKSCPAIRVLDIDKSFKNKLLFYYLFFRNGNPISELMDKAELMTMESQEQIIKNIFHNGIQVSLPATVSKFPFCTVQLSLPFSKYLLIFNIIQPSACFQPFSTNYGFSTPEQVIQSGQQKLFLTAMQKVKTTFESKKDPYIIPFNFKQNANLTINLLQYEKLKKSKQPTSEKIIQEIKNSFNFLP